MRHIELSRWLVPGLALTLFSAAACARTRPTPAAGTANGDVAVMDGNQGMWMDAVGGVWMDTTGMLRGGGPTGRYAGLQQGDVALMNNGNILAHIRANDSLAVALSQVGVALTTNPNVRDYAKAMLSDYAAHRTPETKLSAGEDIPAVTYPGDTTDIAVESRILRHLSRAKAGPSFDRQFMGAMVGIHRHMLHDLDMMKSVATGPTKSFIERTLPEVQRHLKDAQRIDGAMIQP